MLSKSSTYTTCKAVWPEIANFDFCASLMIQASPSLPITQYKFMKYWTQTFFNVLHNFPSGTIYFRAQDKDGILLMSAFCVYCCCSPLFLSSVLMAHLNKALNVSRLSILIFVLNFFITILFKVIPQCASCTAQKNHVIGRIGARENTVSFFQ